MASFLQRGFVVVASYRRKPPAIPPCDTQRIAFVPCDLDSDPLDFPRVDMIVHAAGQSPWEPGATPEDHLRGNVRTTVRVVDYARKVEPRLFVYLSTTAIYGDVTEDVLTESSPRIDPEVHGATRYLGECVLHDADELPRMILRLPEVVGPGCFAGPLGRQLRAAVEGVSVDVVNPDAPFNAVTDVAEIERLILHAFDRRVAGLETLNVATRSPLSRREVAETLIRLAGSTSEIVERTADEPSYRIDTTRLERRLQFEPRTTEEIASRYTRATVENGG
jgi:nucleoside-diphosphate-sugar epimerase